MHMVHITNHRPQQNSRTPHVAVRIRVAARSGATMPTKSIALQKFEAACRARGLSVTVQRRRILEAILDRTDHPTPDQVYASVKKVLPDVSRTTVYRVLEMLTDLGLLTKACTPGAVTRVDPRTARHHHLVCLRCDRLIDVEDAAVDHRIRPPDLRQQAFVIKDYSIYFTGLCAACRQAARISRRSGRPARRPDRKGKTSKRTVPPGIGPTGLAREGSRPGEGDRRATSKSKFLSSTGPSN